MRIPCPYCGERGNEEFVYLGTAALADRPDPAGPDAGRAFYAHVYLRDNPAGLHRELWFHAAGCQSWLVVERDTRTHALIAARLAAEARGPAAP